MSRIRVSIAAGIAGLLAIGGLGVTAAASAATGPQWRIIRSVKSSSGEYTAVVATGKTTGWAFGGYVQSGPETAWERSGGTWTKVAFPGLTNENVIDAAATSPSNVWAFTRNLFGTQSRVLRWTGSKWSVVKTFKGAIGGASVLGTSDVWVYGGTYYTGLGVWHYNGHTWTQVGKKFDGGFALSDTSVWAYLGTNIEHWNGHTWTATSVKSLLPPKQLLNNPAVTGIVALSASNVWAIGNGNAEDEGGPFVVLHYDGHKWSRLAEGGGGYGASTGQQLSLDGSGGLWIPMPGVEGARSFMLHYTGGKLREIALPRSATVNAIVRVPGTAQQLAGGFVPAGSPVGSALDEVILQYS